MLWWRRNPCWESKQDFSVLQPLPCSLYCLCCPAPIVSTFMVHTVAEALHGTAFIQHYSLCWTSKLCQNGEKVELHSSSKLRVFVLKQLTCIPNDVLSDSRPATVSSILWPLPVSASVQHTYRLWPLVPIPLFVVTVFTSIRKTAKRQH